MGDSYTSGRIPIRVQQELNLANDPDIAAYARAMNAYSADIAAYVDRMHADGTIKTPPRNIPENDGRSIYFSKPIREILYGNRKEIQGVQDGVIPERLKALHESSVQRDERALQKAMQPGYVGPAPRTDLGGGMREGFMKVLMETLQQEGADARFYLNLPESIRR